MLHERIGSKMADGAVSSFSAMSPTNDNFCDALSSVKFFQIFFCSTQILICSLKWKEKILQASQNCFNNQPRC